MKKGKRILALCGVVVLVGLYIATLVCALLDSSDALNLFRASIYATIVLPVLIWTYTFIYKLLKDRNSDKNTDEQNEK